ncbi:myo-inositol-1-phosphate synthase [Longispora fulva]|uniref:Myo-inositol-1-phosphate synthase n=1 Tax=Longispora fulva TaxID=619741 RepID=A0A8J7GPK9_9ACTN|nr:inositol-3-phosphate synthase [Longispora fulva]MBG6135583.1 myo-inositol-1-phosphate synthase [Longispora fulva]GIG56178.1 myo-inositol-1-phosphate synthase [Longispora fulva]
MRTGVWLIGARGSVAVTSMVGALAVRASLAAPLGCVTELPELRSAAVPTLGDLVFGGHDMSTVGLVKKARDLAASGVLPGALVEAVAAELDMIEVEVLPAPGGGVPCEGSPDGRVQADTAARIVSDLRAFRDRHDLARIVVVNVSSTEPVATPHPAHADLAALRAALDLPGAVLPASALYAYAALSAGCPFVDFTPSTGARLPALAELAAEARLPHAGSDGKTGETLLKSVLAPMFALRHLRVTSWSGINLLGGGDGATLADPAANAAKTASKHRVLGETLGYQPEGHTRIDHVPELGDFKTAWDLVTFQGFLGTAMRMEFTWHGCDSALAAPLVLDLARLTAAAHAAGVVGPVPELAFFFKDPIGDVPHGLAEQWTLLVEFVRGLSDATA